MNRLSRFALLPLLGVALAASAGNNAPHGRSVASPAATSASLSNVVSIEDSCGGVRYSAVLTFTGTTNDGGGNDTVWFTIYDDHEEKFAQPFTAPLSQQRSYQISAEYPGRVGTVAPGIAVLVGESRGTDELISIDPFFPTPSSGCTIGGTPPAMGFSPTTGTTITYGATGAASPIALSNAGGGTGTGPAATTTVTNCSISGGVAFPTTSFNPNVSMVGTGSPSPASISLPACVPQASATNATLQCVETRGSGSNPLQRTWSLACPASTVVSTPPSLGAPIVEATAVGGGLPNGNSQAPVLSRNGTKIAYTSDANNIVVGDPNTRPDIFLRDRVLATTTRVSQLAEALNPGVQEGYDDPAISGDGATVAFTGSSGQVFVAANNVGRKISANAAGTLGNGMSGNPFPTTDGSLVFFDSRATNLLTGNDGNGASADIFVKNLGNDSVTLISRGPNGEPADGPSAAPSASTDGQTIVFHTLATNIVPATSSSVPFAQNFDGVTAPALPSGWSASNTASGNNIRWQTTSAASPPAVSLPNSVEVDDEATISNKLLDSPLLTISGQPATLSFQRVHNLEVGFDGMVLEISINGGAFNDAVSAGGSFSVGGYTQAISVNFNSPIAGRSAWTGATGGYVPTTYVLPSTLTSGTSVRFRWRMASDATVGSAGARIDSITSTNLTVPSAASFKLPAGVKAGTIQQATMMRGGGFGQSRFYLSRNRTTGELGNGDSTNVRVTPDGRWVVFESLASNLISGDTNGVSDIYRAEISNNSVVGLERVSVTKTGVQGNGGSFLPQISDDGLLVTFQTEATNLSTPADTNGVPDVMVKSMASGDLVRQAQTVSGQEPNGLSVLPTISGDGSTLGFCTLATNVAAGDTNNSADVFSVGINSSLPRDEPGLIRYPLPTPNPADANCPSGFFSAVVDDGPGAGLTAGAFGMEVLLDDPGTRVLAGGLNFGGLIDVSQVGFAAFNIANAANESQRLFLSLSGSPSSSASGSYPVRVRISRRTATTSDVVFDSTQTISLATPFTTTVDLPPAFYEATVAPTSGTTGGTPEGQFFFSLTTSFINRAGGGFQGGAIVGGYHAVHPFGGVSGFAAFCLATPHSTSVRVLSQPSYGAAGAKDLRLRIQDAQQRNVIVVPGG